MFGFGTIFCVLCDRQVSKGGARRVNGRKDIAVCLGCRERWQRSGAMCGRCKTAVSEESEPGIFADRYALGHLKCGAVPLERGQDAAVRGSAG